MISQKMDFLSPLQEIAQRIGEAFKNALPSDAKVKIELETTPLQEVEASIERTKQNLPPTTEERLSGGGGGAGDIGAGSAKEYERAMERIDTIGKRIGHFLRRIDEGKDATGYAAEQVERLRNALERVAEKGKEASEAMGDSGLTQKLEEAKDAAGQGKHGGSGASIGDLERIMRDPLGAASDQFKEKLLNKYGAPLLKLLGADVGAVFGGGMGAAGVLGGIGLGIGAAGAGFAYGWSLNTKWANEATGDAQKAYEDARFSNAFGTNFDLRGRTFDARRLTANGNTALGYSLNNAEVRQAISGMGIGVDNWHGDIIETAMQESRTANKLGISTAQMSSIVGAAIRSGTFAGMPKTDDDTKALIYLQRIAGSTEEAAKHGVATNEHLAVLSTLNQRTIATTGLLSDANSTLNMRAAGAMLATNDRTLMGANTIQLMAGSGSDEQKARMIGFMIGPNGDLLPEYKEMLKSNPNAKLVYDQLGPEAAAGALLEDDTTRAAVFQRSMKSISANNPGVNKLNAARIMGSQGGFSQVAQAVRGSEAGDILTHSIQNGKTDADISTAKGDEAARVRGVIDSQNQTQESRKTAQEWEVYQSILDTNREVAGGMRDLRNWLSQHASVRGYN